MVSLSCNLPIILYCFSVRWFEIIPQMCAPNEWPTQVIILARAPAFVIYEYSWAVHCAANLEIEGSFLLLA